LAAIRAFGKQRIPAGLRDVYSVAMIDSNAIQHRHEALSGCLEEGGCWWFAATIVELIEQLAVSRIIIEMTSGAPRQFAGSRA
jgi:hypothetical protein